MKKLLQEPLVHFFILGACIFILYSLFAPGVPGNDNNRIVVDMDRINRLKALWQRQTNREASPEELKQLIDDYLYEEVYYREARAMGLDENDVIVRRRLVQKIMLITEGLAEQTAPTDEMLMDWYRSHIDSYVSQPRIGFKHIYFGFDNRGEGAERDALTALSQLPDAAGLKEPITLGDSFMLGHEFTDIGQTQLSGLFGADFADALFGLTEGNWQGPVASGFGYHLVDITRLHGAETLSFEESRELVLLDWRKERLRQIQLTVFNKLKDKYPVSYSDEVKRLLAPVPDSAAAE